MLYVIRSRSSKNYAHSTPGQRPVGSLQGFAGSFTTPEAARKFVNENRTRLGFSDPEIVKVEVKEQKTLVALPITAGQTILASDKFVLARATIGTTSYITDLSALLTETLERARTFSTISDGVAYLRLLGRSADANTIMLVRTNTTTKFYETVVEDVSGNFVGFDSTTSSVISRVAFDHATRIARITLKPRARKFATAGEQLEAATYEYSNVDAADIFAFISAPSWGSYFGTTWKAKYDRSARKI